MDENTMHFTEFVDQPVKLCCGDWVANTEEGILKYNKSDGIKCRVGFQPVLITKRIINSENDTEKFEVAYGDQNVWKKKVIPRTWLFNKNMVGKLCDYGIDVSSANAVPFVAYMTDLYSYNKDIIPVEYSRSHLGWTDDTCTKVIPYTNEIFCDAGGGLSRFVDAFHSRGNEKEWYKRIENIRKDQRIRLYIDASFAAPLIKVLNGLGFIVHLWGGTGNGKSVALYAALSVWGDCDKLFLTLTATNLSLELIAHVLQNFPMAGDELTQLDGKTMSPQDVAYLFANGHGKNRGTKEGELQETKEWKTLMLSTGEGPFVDETADGGASARVVEIESAEKMYPTEPNLREFVHFLKENYGFAGKKFIEYVISIGKSKLIERYSKLSSEFMEECRERRLNEKQAVSMSLIKFADELVDECCFTNEQKLEDNVYFNFIKSKDVISTYIRTHDIVLQSAMRDKNTLIITFGEDNIIEDESENKYGKINGLLDKKNHRLYLYETYINEVLRKENARWSFNQFKKDWLDAGYLVCDRGRYTKKTRKLERRAVCFILFDDDNDSEYEYDDEYGEKAPF